MAPYRDLERLILVQAYKNG